MRYLFWETTRRCNLACRHCGSDCSADPQQADLPAPVVLATLRRFAEAYDPRRILLVATGGEPLVRPDLEQVLAEAHGLGYRLGMVSNGLALDEARAIRLARLGLETVVVSLDGPDAAGHEALRRRPGSFEAACAALLALRQAGVPIVEAVSCITPAMLPRLDELYERVRALGVVHWRLMNIFPAGRARQDPSLLLDGPGLVRLIEETARLRRRGAADGLLVQLGEEGYLGWEYDRLVRSSPHFCRAGIQIAGLLADGSLAACPNLPASLAQGNVLHDDPVEVWETRYQRFRDRRWMRQGRCARCDRWPVCQGNSLHLWDEQRGGPCWCQHALLEARPQPWRPSRLVRSRNPPAAGCG